MYKQELQEVVVVSAVRTPIGSIGGSLASLTGPQLGGIVVKAAIEKAKIPHNEVKEVIMGNVLSANVGQAPAKQVAKNAGLADSTICTSVNKVCSSGMKAVMFASQTIMLGQSDVIVAGGFESMSNTPYYLEKARYGYKYGHSTLIDGVLKDGLWDVYNDIPMGLCAEDCAKKYNFSREDQDKFAVESYRRASEAYKNGSFNNELISVQVPGIRKGEFTTVTEDEEYKKLKLDKISTLRPAFDPKGTVTAANSSKLNDGASALVLMSAAKAKQLGVKPIARILGFGDAEQEPIQFPTAPSKAIPKALANAGIKQENVDYYELNEAFSVVILANNKLLNLDPSRVNIWGGGVSLGHPIGSSGSRIITTLINVLHSKNGKIGVAGICNGGGGASAVVIERL